MGGKKKLGIKQMEKQQEDKAEDKSKKEKKTGPPQKKTNISIMAPDVKDDKIIAEIKKMSVLTPYAIATRYGIRISAAKDFLEQLENNGAIQLVSGSHSLKIYKPAA
ncbi:MAG: 30S ribosomal protein S25e [Nitrososphaerota archaeon]|jgi:small subunit ribosomal protein S25e|nr:30S ribosomal protein S25e [Nitrososphaerota archaeon]